MRTSKSGKPAASATCEPASPGSAGIQIFLDANPEKSGFCRDPARQLNSLSACKTFNLLAQRNHLPIGTARALQERVRWREGPAAFPKPLTHKQGESHVTNQSKTDKSPRRLPQEIAGGKSRVRECRPFGYLHRSGRLSGATHR